MDFQSIWENFVSRVVDMAPNVVAAIAIFIIGRIIAGIVGGAVRRAMQHAKSDPALIGFISSIARTLVLVFVVLASLRQLGVPTESAVAIVGAAGLAIAFALQGSLGNFAAGVMILIFKPFGLGDYVNAGGEAGTVVEIGIFTTTLKTPDNQKVIVPNGQITGGSITNVTAFDTRRIDLVVGVSYSDHLGQTKEILERILTGHEKVLKDPAPVVAVSELGDSSVNFVARPWVNTSDYWVVRWELTKQIKEALDEAGISIPFPQRDVHLFQESA